MSADVSKLIGGRPCKVRLTQFVKVVADDEAVSHDITPEMLDAGAAVIEEWRDVISSRGLARDIYAAMKIKEQPRATAD